MRHALAFLLLLTAPACQDDHDHDHDDTDDTPADTDTSPETDEPADTDDTGAGPAERIVLASATDGEITVELLGWHGLIVGWNNVIFRVTDADGAPVTGAAVTQAPLMDMEMMDHACPYTRPAEASAGDYEAEIVPIMASGMMGSWSDTVTVDAGGGVHTVTLADLEVTETQRKKDIDVDGTPWIVTLTPLAEVEVGDVPFIATVHRRETMMSFPPVEDLTVTVTPWMPSMGHGSEGNVDPVYEMNGRYRGSTNFSMGGAWEVTLQISDGSTPIGSAVYAFDL